MLENSGVALRIVTQNKEEIQKDISIWSVIDYLLPFQDNWKLTVNYTCGILITFMLK